MSDRPYREVEPEQAPVRLVFYPHFSALWGALGVVSLLVSAVVLLTFPFSLVWSVTPLLALMVYATRGERHEVAVSDHKVSLRWGLWPLRGRERLLPRGDVVAVLLEEYDGEGRVTLQTRRDGKIPLTEAFQTDLSAAQRTQRQLQQVIFPEE